MGMVFQAYSLFPNMTAEQNVEYGLRDPRAARRPTGARGCSELLELVGLGHAGKRYPHQLSGGMQQRVALARALAIEPRVLLLDEPLSALDAKVRVQLREEIRRIQLELGITTIYVTHDQEEALSISDRVAVMYGGRIEQVGTPAEMYGGPATPFVAEFIGTMNRLASTVADDGVVEYGGPRLRVDAARGLPRGERVLCSSGPRPSSSRAAADGAEPGGRVRRRGRLAHLPRLGHARSGSRTQRRGRAHRRPADHAGAGAADRRRASRARSRPTARAAQPRGAARACRSRSGRSLKIPSTPSAASSRIRSASFTV